MIRFRLPLLTTLLFITNVDLSRPFLIHRSNSKLTTASLCTIHRDSDYNSGPTSTRNKLTGNTSLSLSGSDSGDEVKKLRDQAERYRREVENFEQGKREEVIQKETAREKIIQEKLDLRNRYSADVPILKGDGQTELERVDFPPRIKGDNSKIFTYQAPLPLGLILGEHESIPGATSVDEVSPEGNAFSAGVKEGDVLRAVTACQVTMKTPTWQLIAGGIGQPKTSRFMFSTDGVAFEEVMNAVGSNRMDPEERDVWIVVERVTS